MSPPVRAAPFGLFLLFLGSWFIAETSSQLFQRRVCPSVGIDYLSKDACKDVKHLCNSDKECNDGERCCPQENKCELACRATVIAKGCPIPIDLTLLLDSSGSIGRRNWKKVQRFAKSVVDIYDISEKGTHIAIIAYSSDAVIEINFDKYTGVERNAVNIKRDIDKFKLQKGLTFIDKALDLANREVFTKAAGMREDRTKVALVLTDGIQTTDRGTFTPLVIASKPLKDKGVLVYSLGVGQDIDVMELIQMATTDEYVFSARNFDDLGAKVQDITRTQCKACEERVDVVFGIPDSNDLGEEFNSIKKFFTKMTDLLKINARKAHVGIIRFSDTAEMTIPIDAIDHKPTLKNEINKMQMSSTSGVDFSKALQVAADHAFTMFGGVRQIVPKTFVLFVPKQATVDNEEIKRFATKLKSIGVRLMLVGLQKNVDKQFYDTISSQPAQRYVVTGFDHQELGIAAFEAADTICKGKYGKCPAYQNTAQECPPGAEDECQVDKDCGEDSDQMCCQQPCGRECTKKVDNCFITMDVALVVDSSAAMSADALDKVKKFLTNLVHGIADAENSIHFGLVTYGERAKTVMDFNKFVSESGLKAAIQGLTTNNDQSRRVDLALETVKKDVFSLEGGMRQGHPRYAVFITAGDTDAASEDLAEASKALRGLDVNIMAVGVDGSVSKGFLDSLATNPSYVYPSASADALATQRGNMEKAMCNAKPGKCVAPFLEDDFGCDPEPPPDEIPCGPSNGDPEGKGNDWICPGEQKCCKERRQGCYYSCADVPLNCPGMYDLTLLLESSDDVGPDGFEKLKTFAKQFINGFEVADFNTRVSVVTYGGPAKVQFTLKSLGKNALRKKVLDKIDNIKFLGGPGGAVSSALEKAVMDVYTVAGGTRDAANKSLVIFGSGKVSDPGAAAGLANQLRQKQVDVFAMPIGGQGDLSALKGIASKNVEKNIFVTSSYNALKPHLRSLTDTVCQGAEKLRPCGLPLDIVLGIPTARTLGGDFAKVKNTFTSLLKFFKVSNRLSHVGVVQYSDNAALTLPIDKEYNRQKVIQYIDNIKPSGDGYNVQAALKVAADHAFSTFGGVRQTIPKVFVLFVPRASTSDMAAVNKAAQALKDIGIQIVVFALDQVPNADAFKTISSAPSRKFFYGGTFMQLAGQVYTAKETICRARYGKCPPDPPPDPACADPKDECSLDTDCPSETHKCCASGCGRKCSTKVDNCFVSADILIAIDNSNALSDDDLNKVKTFANNMVHTLSSSENNIHIAVASFSAQADIKTNLRGAKPYADIKATIDSITTSSEAADYENALKTFKKDVFSLEGGMRQGHPRYTVILSAQGHADDSWKDPAQVIKDMDWMNLITVGVKGDVPGDFLSSMASPGRSFPSAGPADLPNIRGNVENAFCNPKRGKCIAPTAPPEEECPGEADAEDIPCGKTDADKSDWHCPGEQKCCKSENSCFFVCRDPPLECDGKHDLTLLLESNDAVGAVGFEKVKTFAKQLVDGFPLSNMRTKVSVITYNQGAKFNFRFNTLKNVNKKAINQAIDKLKFQSGGDSSTASALEQALVNVYKPDFGMRDDSNKSLVVISQGKFSNPDRAARFAYLLRLNNVDVFQVAVGGAEDVPSIRRVASPNQDKTVFITSSYDALKPHLRALTRRICEGAEKLKPCDRPLDIVYGIPVATDLGRDLADVKLMFQTLTRRFVVNNRKVHIGLLPYSNTAELTNDIDDEYNPSTINSRIQALRPKGSGYNVAKAITAAADHAFTIFGGTRQTSPKTFVLMVPGPIAGEAAAVEAAAAKLKGMGVRLMVFGLDGQADKALLSRVSTQPTKKFLPMGSYDALIAATEQAADTICAGKYGKCVAVPPPAECPPDVSIGCDVDSDCADEGQACCSDGCKGTGCSQSLKNCFVNMDIGLVIDSTTPDLADVQNFVKRFVSSIADSENSVHFGLLSFGPSAVTHTNFRNFASEAQIRSLVDGIAPSPGDRRVDIALKQLKTDVFSLEGGMRHGHPKFAVFVTSGATAPDSEDLKKASKELNALGVKTVAIGTISAVNDADLVQLASEAKYIFKSDAASTLVDKVPDITKALCNVKPGECPPVDATCNAPGDVPLEYIPCGDSAGKAGRGKENDWDCPGEQRCCKDPTGCHSICRDPPNECKGVHDLTILLDASNDMGEAGFQKAKTFAKQLASAFDVSRSGTHVGVVSYGNDAAKVDMNLKKFQTKDSLLRGIESIKYQGGQSSTSKALSEANRNIYSSVTGARDGVNKSLVIISTGRFQSPAAAIAAANELKLKQVDVFAVPVGSNPDLPTLRKVVSRMVEKNVFMTTSPDALRPHLRAVTNAICEGAEKIKVCDKKMDVVFGIPTAKSLGKDFQKIKTFYTNMVKLFKVSNRNVHVGLVPYSDTASVESKLDTIYNRGKLMSKINDLSPSGSGFNVADAVRVASDHVFTIFGGVRQTAPKTFVLFVPRGVSSSDEISAATAKLKSVGVRLMVVELGGQEGSPFSVLATQPPRKHHLRGSFDDINAATYDAVQTICNAEYGKCPAFPPPTPADCSDKPADQCATDGDCKDPELVCCSGGCGERVCKTRVKNCLVAMDIAVAVDTTSGVPDAEFEATKKFVTRIINSNSVSENNVHYGLVKYGSSAETLASFNKFVSDTQLRDLINNMAKSGDADRRLDLAARKLKSDVFSLEGRMRQGRPRFAIVVTSGGTAADSEDLAKATKELKDIGVQIIAVGSNPSVDDATLTALAGSPDFVFKANTPDDFEVMWNNIQEKMCPPKPGNCPVSDRPPAGECKIVPPASEIPCDPTAGKGSDWPCPGEQKCCKSDDACFSVCRDPPNVCNGQFDLTLLLDASDDVTELGFSKVKAFAKDLVDAFDVSSPQTRVAIVSYGQKAKLNLGLKELSNLNREQVKNAIDNVRFAGGGPSSTADALELAVNNIYVPGGGMRRSSNKSLVIISTGRFANAAKAARLAGSLKQSQVDVFAMPVGDNPDIPALRRVASRIVDKNVFMTSSYDALRPHLRAMTKTICDGAEKLKVCEIPMDVVYGVPVASSLSKNFAKVKNFFTSMTKQFAVNNRKTHIGLITYNNQASMVKPLDKQYNRAKVIDRINNLKPSGSGFNVAAALRVAADNAFTIFGGVRQTVPKTFVLYVPSKSGLAPEAIEAAAKKLKSVGVRLMIVGLKDVDEATYQRVSTQPPRKHFLYGDYDEFGARVFDAADTICQARYLKCPAYPPPAPPDCSVVPDDACATDADCQNPDEGCCAGGCGERICTSGVKNCFVTMDVAIAIDNSAGVSDNDFEEEKKFATRVINSISDSENSIHYGLLTFGQTAQTLTDFNGFKSESQLRSLVKNMKKSAEPDRRIDVALRKVKSDIFSLEGGMRQGHPRYVIFITSGATADGSEDLSKASEDLRKLGVKIVAVGINKNVDLASLGSLATNDRLAFRPSSPKELEGLWSRVEANMCSDKPGTCPSSPNTCQGAGGDVPLELIPCGDSVAGKEGRSTKQNDWDCPGEQRCCKDPTGCHSVCREPPNECKGKYDVVLILDASNTVGQDGFNKVKGFAKQLVDAFDISQGDTKYAVITSGQTSNLELRFDTLVGAGLNKDALKTQLDRVTYQGGDAADIGEAMSKAEEAFKPGNGARLQSKKRVVIISTGPITNPIKAAAVASRLKQEGVGVYGMPVGKAPDIAALRKIVSPDLEKNVFVTSSHNALRPHLRALTKAICEDVVPPKVCDTPMDIVFGFPNAKPLADQLETAKTVFSSMLRMFDVSNRLVHVGLIKYSDNAQMPYHLDAEYNKNKLQAAIKNIQGEGLGVNVAAAIRLAANNAFTVFGGVRQTVPKTFILFVPGKASVPDDVIATAAAKLKSMGVKLMIFALEDADKALYQLASSQPARKFLIHGNADLLGASVLESVDTVCKGRYKKCPPFLPTTPDQCEGADVKDECAVDDDCADPEHGCCAGKCGERVCRTRVKNCFVTMDVALAIDTSDGMSDEDLTAAKNFATTLVNAFSDSENSIRFGLTRYGQDSSSLVNFKQNLDEKSLRGLINGIQKTGGAERRIDLAMNTIKSDLFSLEGGMRQGHPRYVIFLAGGGNTGTSDDLKKAAKTLTDLGVNIMAVGVNSNAGQPSLAELATQDRFVFTAASSADLPGLWPQLEAQMCQEKPGECAAAPDTCQGAAGDVPLELIPCGDSVAGKEGRNRKQNDWDCPGEQRCCKDPTGCHSVCREPPNVCTNAAHDLVILIESSDAVGASNFEKAKKFAKDIVSAFNVADPGTHVSVITYSSSSEVNIRLNSLSGPMLTSRTVNENIDRIPYQGGTPASPSLALGQAVNQVFTDFGGTREGVNKSLVLIGSGQFQDASAAVGFGAALKQNLVDVFAVPVGENPDVATLRAFASPNVEKTVFMTSSHNALRPHVRAVTKAICDGAIKIRKCDEPVDIYFGIPVSSSISPQYQNVQKMFTSLLSLLKVNNRLVHTGLIRYSDSADVVLNLDRVYDRDSVASVISRIPISGSSLNLARALEVAADNGFTLYGGVRQTVPKIMVLYVPGPVSSPSAEIRAAANKLKGLGVRVIVIGLTKNVDKALYSAVASQPASKFILTADSFAGLNLALNAASNRICNAKYGRCPKPPPPPPECSKEPVNECSQDKDCKTPGDLCCADGCEVRTCQAGVKNCFVPMEVAFAVDNSETVETPALAQSKDFVKEMIRSFADSENDIHFGVMQFAGSAKALTPGFKNAKSEEQLRTIIDSIDKSNDPTRRVDLALETASREIFSLEGYTRQGHPRYLVFVISSATSPDSGDLVAARKQLDELGVKTVVVAMNKGMDPGFLSQLASDNSLIFQADSPAELEKIRPQVEAGFCDEKPGQCPVPSASPDPAVCNAQAEVPAKFIPCGNSAKKPGRAQRENDWDCPGEQKCCQDPDTGCHNVCVEPPLVCKKVKDIELVVESTDQIGKAGYAKLKQFLQYFSSAFPVSRDGAQIGLITYSSRPRDVFRLNSHRNNKAVSDSIGKAKFLGGQYPVPSLALVKALDVSLTNRGGARADANKSLVLFTTGRFDKPGKAIAVAQQLKEKLVDVFTVAIGDNPDFATMRSVVSEPVNNNVFMMSSTDALRAQARALVKRVCDGGLQNPKTGFGREVKTFIIGGDAGSLDLNLCMHGYIGNVRVKA